MIDRIDLYKYHLPLIHPVSWASTQHTHRTGLLICLSSSNHEGWGEISPLPGFSQESLSQAIKQSLHYSKLLISCPDLSPLIEDQHIHPSVLFGFELAHHNLNKALHRQPAPSPCPITSCKLVTHELRNPSVKFTMSGYKAIKLKVGLQTLEQDIEFVHHICNKNPGIKIRIDANRGWNVNDAKEFVDQTQGLMLDYIEEPLQDKTQLFQFGKFSAVPLALDETLRESDAERYRPIADVLVIKPTLFGGRTKTLELIDLAHTHLKRCVISSSYESGIGLLGLIELAQHCPDEVHGLDTYQIFQKDVFTDLLPLMHSRMHNVMNSVIKSDLNVSSLEEVFSTG